LGYPAALAVADLVEEYRYVEAAVEAILAAHHNSFTFDIRAMLVVGVDKRDMEADRNLGERRKIFIDMTVCPRAA
jgi:hypothetical protein